MKIILGQNAPDGGNSGILTGYLSLKLQRVIRRGRNDRLDGFLLQIKNLFRAVTTLCRHHVYSFQKLVYIPEIRMIDACGRRNIRTAARRGLRRQFGREPSPDGQLSADRLKFFPSSSSHKTRTLVEQERGQNIACAYVLDRGTRPQVSRKYKIITAKNTIRRKRKHREYNS